MAATAVQIVLAEFTAFLRPENGWHPAKLGFPCKEHVFDWVPEPTRPEIVIRVYSSISTITGLSRQVGGDAIRVCAVNLQTKWGLSSSTRVHRVENWRENLKERVLEIRASLHDRGLLEPKAEPVPAPKHEAADALFAILKTAKDNGLKFPKLRFEHEGQRLVVSVSGAGSKTPGALDLTDGRPYGQNVWFGRILTDGTLFCSRRWEEWVGATLVEFAKNPAGFAKVYGQKTGNCCFCGRHLETKESVAVGYGPVCAAKFALPWGR